MSELAVFVEHFEQPPTKDIVSAIKNVLSANYSKYKRLVAHGHSLPKGVSTPQCVMYGMELARGLVEARTEISMASSVVPAILELQEGKKTVVQPVVFVAVRDAKGNEWFYPHYLEGTAPPATLVSFVECTINDVMRARGSFDQAPDHSDFKEASAFMHAVISGVRYVLRGGAGTHVLHS